LTNCQTAAFRLTLSKHGVTANAFGFVKKFDQDLAVSSLR
jgi:hypothetical protein